MRLAAQRAALRIARRDARRSRARSILVVSMIALPVLALSTADVLARTAQLSPAEEISREMGASDAALVWSGYPIAQDPRGSQYGGAGVLPASNGEDVSLPKPSLADVRKVLPSGSQVVPSETVRAAIRTKDGVKVADLTGFDYAVAPVRGLIRQVKGRAPRTGDEIALSRTLSRAIGQGIGDSVATTRPAKKMFRVVGIVEDPYNLKLEGAYTVPAGLPAAAKTEGPGSLGTLAWYADTPSPVSWEQVVALNAKGYQVKSREVILRPPPPSAVPYYAQQPSQSAVTVQEVAIVGLAVGMALLEVVLLAGPAFAVGARRRRRELALISATGGEQRDVRNVVLSSGAVLGLTAGIVGIALGVAAAAGLLPLLERATGSVAGHFDIRPLELAGVALLGLVTGLAAAYPPARSAAKQDVVAALAGRRGVVRTRARVPLIGLLVAIAGTVIAIGGALTVRNALVVLAGAVVAEAGLIICTPALLGLAGRLGRRLPLAPRMALRDAARNRSSAAPAVAAVMAAVAGSVGIGIFVSSLSARDQATYWPTLAHGDAAVQLEFERSAAPAPQIVAALQRTLPARSIVTVSGLSSSCFNGQPCTGISALLPSERVCPSGNPNPDAEQIRRMRDDPRCNHQPRWQGGLLPGVQIDDGSALSALAGVPAADAVAALRAGKVVVFDPELVKNGTVTLEKTSDTRKGPQGQKRQVPAYVLTEGYVYAQLVLPPQVARSFGVSAKPLAVYADNRSLPTEQETQAAQGELAALGVEYLYVERGYVNRYNIGLLALIIASAVITLGAASIATALSNVDGRQDLITLAAVGASPRVRRVLSMSRAGVIAILGTALGTVAGFIPPVGLILVLRTVAKSETANAPLFPLDIPWVSMAITTLVVPAIAIVIAGLFSRSRLPVERRPAT